MNSFCIIGLDAFGRALTETLATDKKQVMIIDENVESVTELADLVTNPVIGDPTSEAVLKAASVADYECCIVSIEGDINDSILVTLLLKELKVKYIVARAYNERHKKVLEHIGADMVVFPEKDMGERLAFTLGRDSVAEFVEFKGYQLLEIDVPAAWYGKNMIELNLRGAYRLNVIALRPKKEEDGDEESVDVLPDPKRPFRDGDRVSVIGTSESIGNLMKKVKI